MVAPSLPVETWLAILDLATFHPIILPPDMYSRTQHDWFNDSRHTRLEELQRPLVVKRAIVSVCRQWRTLSMPLLYECLLLRESSHVALLLDSLSTYQGTSERPLGASVKRLDIFLDKSISSEEQAHLSALPALLHLLPNLVVLDVHVLDPPWPLSATNAIIDACPQSLQVFQWRVWSNLTKQSLFKLLRRCPKLCLLALLHPLWDSHEEYRESTSGLLMESLTFLNVVSPDGWIGSFGDMFLPSLREVHLCDAELDLPTTGSCRFLAMHGKQLTHLILTYDFEREVLDLVGDLCPHLQTLEFEFSWDFDSEIRFGSQPLVLPPVKELWLHYLINTSDGIEVDFELFFLKRFLSAGQPHIEAVRLLSRDGFGHLGEEHLQLLADCRACVPVYLSHVDSVQLSHSP